ncbi:hypothetical protein A3A79_02465 [Candidatus Gottesmanbacteria bacterium RIFCSPLOWO2_01_FULL_43_11b]|uniref:Uncharacterized protein n=1 Tax=Candidatus Gottesmanbacteria bacterium RIFCSPLOWO2_01_FULL_43_11b TaxID=1798392 RepID=A0A1F6AHF1_9BACT|nr:MAG: hypothetical protein A3A79_02465 [Candidatus Gottesmanbacteria bacterium RIFCSPLOWO2_01_FULL_43_11b]
MAKSQLRLIARDLRKSGLGIKTIAKKLGVSSSTASLWCRDIVLSPQQIQVLGKNAHDPYYGKRKVYIERQKQLKEDKIRQLFQRGIIEVAELTPRELFIAGIALYWAEGFKKDNLMGFSNSDPNMIRFMVRWLKEACNISIDRLRFRLGLNETYKDKVQPIQKYWQKILRVSDQQFQKPFFQKVKWQKIYDNPENYHGVLRIRVSKSTDLLRKIHGWIAGLYN